MYDEKEYTQKILGIVDDAEIEQIFDDRVLISVDRFLWDDFVNSIPNLIEFIESVGG